MEHTNVIYDSDSEDPFYEGDSTSDDEEPEDIWEDERTPQQKYDDLINSHGICWIRSTPFFSWAESEEYINSLSPIEREIWDLREELELNENLWIHFVDGIDVLPSDSEDEYDSDEDPDNFTDHPEVDHFGPIDVDYINSFWAHRAQRENDFPEPQIEDSISKELFLKFQEKYKYMIHMTKIDHDSYPYSVHFDGIRQDWIADLRHYFKDGLDFDWSEYDIMTILYIRESRFDPSIGHKHMDLLRQKYFINPKDIMTLALIDSVSALLKLSMSFCDRVLLYGDKLSYHFP